MYHVIAKYSIREQPISSGHALACFSARWESILGIIEGPLWRESKCRERIKEGWGDFKERELRQ